MRGDKEDPFITGIRNAVILSIVFFWLPLIWLLGWIFGE